MTNIMEMLQSAPTLKTLLRLVQAADLGETLTSTAALTLFAPADEAFAKLPAGILDSLMSDKGHLKSIVAHHIVEGRLMVKDLAKVDSLIALDQQSLTIEHTNGVLVDKAKIVQADINCDNGVVHVIDSPILAVP